MQELKKTQFGPGTYKTENGRIAIVAQVKVLGGQWFLRGAVMFGNVAVMAKWTLEGEHVYKIPGANLTMSKETDDTLRGCL